MMTLAQTKPESSVKSERLLGEAPKLAAHYDFKAHLVWRQTDIGKKNRKMLIFKLDQKRGKKVKLLRVVAAHPLFNFNFWVSELDPETGRNKKSGSPPPPLASSRLVIATK